MTLQIINNEGVEDLGLPSILYKYRTLKDTHIDILINNRVFFAAPNSFEDTNDCKPPEIFPDKHTVYDFLWSESIRLNPNISYQERESIVNNQLRNAPILNVEKRDALIKDLFVDYCKCHGVFSVTANCHNDKMWESYADSHKGICIGFNSSKLASVSGGGGPVTYCDVLPPIKIFKDSAEDEHIKRVFYKERKWEYEEEYRLHKTWPINYIKEDSDRYITLPKDCIITVICGGNMDKEEFCYIQSIVKTNHPNATLILPSNMVQCD